jgi:hypothetical protein
MAALLPRILPALAPLLQLVLLSTAADASPPQPQGGLVRPEAPKHRPIYVKVETALPCSEVVIGQTLLKLRPLLANCAMAGKKAKDGTFRMGTAIFNVELGGKKPKFDAGKGSLSPAVRACMVRKVLARLPMGDPATGVDGWPKQKCSIRLTIRAD